MSHELRTPLNSLLILSDQLCKNPDGNLSGKQVEFSKTIHSSGNDLLMLINDILDLSQDRVRHGGGGRQRAARGRPAPLGGARLPPLRRVQARGLRQWSSSTRCPRPMVTDVKRLQQIIKNLLSNAFKFTHEGQVTFSIATATSGWSVDNDELHRAGTVLAFSVRDTGIGISPDKQQIIFEAFQQADGLHLAQVRRHGPGPGHQPRAVQAAGWRDPPGQHARQRAASFTLYLPQSYNPARGGRHARAGANAALALPANVSDAETDVQPRPRRAGRPWWPRACATGATRRARTSRPATPSVFANAADDDRTHIATGDRVLLIVENDLAFARVLLAGGAPGPASRAWSPAPAPAR